MQMAYGFCMGSVCLENGMLGPEFANRVGNPDFSKPFVCYPTMQASASNLINTRFFTSYSGARLPLNLVGELAPDDVRCRNSYYQGLYDIQGRLLRCEKMVYGEIEVCHEYSYHPDGRLARGVIQALGEDPASIDYPS